MQGVSVAVCTPVREGFSREYVYTLLQLQRTFASSGVRFTWLSEPEGTILSRKRDRLAHAFLASGSTHSLWIDSDVGVPVKTVLDLLTLDVEFATAPCLLRHGDPGMRRFSVSLRDLEQVPVHGAVRVERTGFGDCLIRRSVFERLEAANPQMAYTDELSRSLDGSPFSTKPSFFLEDIAEDGLREGEDYSFCRRWRAVGGEIWALLDSEVSHQGRVGHFGHEVWDSRAELAEIRRECQSAFERLEPAHAELVGWAGRAEALCLDTTSERETIRVTRPRRVPVDRLDLIEARAAVELARGWLLQVDVARRRLEDACKGFERAMANAGGG
jgi:hypothetical protein